MGWLSPVFIFLADTLKIAAQVNNSNPAKHSAQKRYFNKHARECETAACLKSIHFRILNNNLNDESFQQV